MNRTNKLDCLILDSFTRFLSCKVLAYWLIHKLQRKCSVVNTVPRANVIKLFTSVIYHHSMVILSFCVIKLYYPGNYHRMAVHYHSILTLEKVGLEVPW
jgi:hypothetical protein